MIRRLPTAKATPAARGTSLLGTRPTTHATRQWSTFGPAQNFGGRHQGPMAFSLNRGGFPGFSFGSESPFAPRRAGAGPQQEAADWTSHPLFQARQEAAQRHRPQQQLWGNPEDLERLFPPFGHRRGLRRSPFEGDAVKEEAAGTRPRGFNASAGGASSAAPSGGSGTSSSSSSGSSGSGNDKLPRNGPASSSDPAAVFQSFFDDLLNLSGKAAPNAGSFPRARTAENLQGSQSTGRTANSSDSNARLSRNPAGQPSAGQPSSASSSSRGDENPFERLQFFNPFEELFGAPTRMGNRAAERAAAPTASEVKAAPVREAQQQPTRTAASSAQPKVEQQQQQQAPKPNKESGPTGFPFSNLFRSLGESCPVQIYESANHATVELEVPLTFPQFPTFGFRGSQTKMSDGNEPKLTIMNPRVKADAVTGTITVEADLQRAVKPEEKIAQAEEFEPLQQLFGMFGVPLQANPIGAPTGLTFRRQVQLSPQVYAVEGAKPFVEEGLLRLYVPKRAVQTSTTANSASASTSKAEQPAASSSSSSASTSTSSSASASRAPYTIDPAPKPAAATEATPSAKIPAETSSSTSTTATATSAKAQGPAPAQGRTQGGAALVQWPPSVAEVANTPAFVEYNCSVPAIVPMSNLTIEFDTEHRRLVLAVEYDHKVTTPVSEETQRFSFKRFLEVPEGVEPSAVTCELLQAAEEGSVPSTAAHEMRIKIPKPQPKQPENKKYIRIPIQPKQQS
jgi:hypothetical protein